MDHFRRHYRSHVSWTAALVALVATSPVFAQSQDPEAPATESNGLADIIVTAQRRQQSLQDVPIAVTAISGDELSAKQIRTTIDIPRLVPNMTGTTNVGIGSANTYFIRGLGNTESISTFDPPVGTYVDDIYVSRQNANNFTFFDVDRIEVMRGPQGTLFGRNTTGGAINVVLKKPAETMGGYAEASYGAYNQWTGRASLDLPLSVKEAMQGAEVEVPTLKGPVRLRVPAGTQSGKIFKLAGKGIPVLQGYGRGDELVIVRVETPTSLTSRQKELLSEFAKEAGEDIHPMGKSFFDKVKELFD